MSAGLQIREPDVAGAISRCVASRALGAPTAVHQVACGWEDYPTEVLAAALRDFTAWAEFDDRANTTGRHVLRTFADLPRERQRELITAAQAFPDVAAKPVEPVETPPADVPEEPAWLTQPTQPTEEVATP